MRSQLAQTPEGSAELIGLLYERYVAASGWSSSVTIRLFRIRRIPKKPVKIVRRKAQIVRGH
jgi:hypothetical protein